MGIIYCENCEGQASDQADACPHCGHPLRAVVNKKLKFAQKLSGIMTVVGMSILMLIPETANFLYQIGILLSILGIFGILFLGIGEWFYYEVGNRND